MAAAISVSRWTWSSRMSACSTSWRPTTTCRWNSRRWYSTSSEMASSAMGRASGRPISSGASRTPARSGCSARVSRRSSPTLSPNSAATRSWRGAPNRPAEIIARPPSRDWPPIHFQVQPVALVRMALSECLVELYTESRIRGRDHVAVLPSDRFFQDVAVKALPALDALQDQEIRAAGRKLDIGRAHHRTAIQMRCDLYMLRLGHAGNLLRLEQATDTAQVHLPDGG